MAHTASRFPALQLLSLALLWAALGCGDPQVSPPDSPPVDDPPVDAAEVVAISLSPTDVVLLVEERVTLQVAVTLEDGGEQVLTKGVTWSNTAPEVATVGSDGTVTGVAVGETILEAAVGAFKATSRVSVLEPDAITSLEVTPPRLYVTAGSPYTPEVVVTAILRDGTRLDVSEQVTWRPEDPDRLMLLPTGELLAFTYGPTKLTGSFQGLPVEVGVQVQGSSLNSIRWTEDLYRLQPVAGYETSFRVEGEFSSGRFLDLTAYATYSLSHPAVAVVEPGTLGVASAPAQPIDLQVTASLGGKTATAQVRVAPQRLFVANTGASSILAFAISPGMTGNVAPLQRIVGDGSVLSMPSGAFFDSAHDELIVADEGWSAVPTFAGALGNDEDRAPLRTLQARGRNVAVAYDAARDILYVAERGDVDVHVYAGVREHTTGSPPPTRTLRLIEPATGLALDVPGDRLFISYSGGGARVRVVEGASESGGIHRNFRASAATANAIALDADRQRLYAVTMSRQVLVFTDVDTANPTEATATISVPDTTGLTFRGVAYDPDSDSLYVSASAEGSSTILVFANVRTFAGEREVAPVARIEGPATLLNNPRGLTIGW